MMILLVLGVLQTALIRPYYRNNRLKTIEVLADTIIDELLENGNVSKTNTDAAFKSILNNRACAYIVNDDGQIIYQSDALGATCMFNHELTLDNNTFMLSRNPDYLMEVLRNEHTYSKTVTSEISSRDMLIYGSLIRSDLVNYYLFINTELEPVDSLIGLFTKQYLLIAVLIAMIAVVISLFLTNKLSLPIVKMKKEADKLVNGDYSASFIGDSFSEINDLADTLNNATNKLSKMNELRKDLVANVSHDIKTPLTMIKAYSEMIRDISGDDPQKRNEHLNVIIKEADYLDRLVVDMRELSQMEAGYIVLNRDNFDIKEAALDIIELYDSILKKRNITVNTSLESAFVWADEIKISQVISNFLSNAINHSYDNSVIDMSIINSEDKLRFEIRDYGSGINEEDLPYIWDRYYKIDKGFKRDIKSTGLGLAIVKAILEAHKARYGVISKVNEGSTFYFELSRDYEEDE